MPHKRQPREIWAATRRRILERDQWQCVHCHVALTIRQAHIDHILSGNAARIITRISGPCAAAVTCCERISDTGA
jgi:hypothetical protein